MSGPWLQLQEHNKNNFIIFGLQEDEREDINKLKALFSNLGVDVNVDSAQLFRIRRSLEKCQPLIVKLKNQEEKAGCSITYGRKYHLKIRATKFGQQKLDTSDREKIPGNKELCDL